MMKRLLLPLSLLLSAALATASATAPGPQPKDKSLPTVFVLGEFEAQYESLSEGYQRSLLEACDCGQKEAFGKWIGMLNEFDVYARKQNVDIRGVKLWMHVFFEADGSVEHIAYHLRPNSRQLDAETLSPLLEGFAAQYQFPVTGEEGFAHYSTGAFPVFGELTGSNQ